MSPAEEFEPHVLDENQVKDIVSEALVDSGYADDDALKAAVLKAMNSHVATSKAVAELASKAVTKEELYSEVITHGPGVDSDPDTPEEIEAQEKLTTKIWGLTNTGTTGYVQKNIAATGMVLCEAKVSRSAGGVQVGRFLTSDHGAILTHYTGPAGQDFVKAGRTLDKKLSMVVGRQPALATTIARQMATAVKQAIAAIPHADPKHIAELVAEHITDEAESA